MTVLRILACLGAALLIATIDGVITGTLSVFWGDLFGCRYGDVVSGSLAMGYVWHLTGRLTA